MQRAYARRIAKCGMWCIVALFLRVTIPAFSQESQGAWKLMNDPAGGYEVSARSEISTPQGTGFATLKIKHQAGANPPSIVYLIVESPKRLPMFPFEKYDGPVEKTPSEYMAFEVSGELGRTRSVKVIPNGFYSITPPDAFIFDTIDKGVVSFLLEVKDGQKLSVTVNDPTNPIHVVFETAGLKQLLAQMGMKAMPRHNAALPKK
jgi:hypothetical protein